VQDRLISVESTRTIGSAARVAEWADNRRWAAVGVIALVICGYILALMATQLDIYYVIGGAVCLAIGAIIARSPELGLFAYFLIAPFTIGESPEVASQNSDYGAGLLPSQIALAFLLLMWMIRMLVSGKWKLVKNDLNRPLFALGGVVLASLICSQFIFDDRIPKAHHLLITQGAEAGLFLLAIGAFLLAANTLTKPKWMNALFYPILIIGVYTSVSRLLDVPTIVPTPKSPLITSIAAAYVLSRLLFSAPRRWPKVGLIVVLILCVVVPYISYGWVSGLIAMTTTLLTLVWLKSRKAFVWVAVALLLVAVCSRPFLSGMYQDSESQGDFDRFQIWADAGRMAIGTNPILGIGPGNFYPYSFRYGTIWYGRNTYTTAHNNYAQVTAEMGLLGLLALFWVVYAGVRMGLKLFRETRSDLQWIPAAATAIFVGFASSSVLGDYMFPNRANGGLFNFGISVYIWLTLGAAVAAARVSTKKQRQEVPGGPQ
jgi:O-antigen ligase